MNMGGKAGKFAAQAGTYLFLTGLSLAVLYPLSITAVSAFKPGNRIAFTLVLNTQWTANYFVRLFEETLFGKWVVNTLWIAALTMVCQVAVVALGGYAFSRFRFPGRQRGMKLFLIVQMIPTMAAFTAFYVMALLVDGFDRYWFLTLIFVGGGVPMNIWLTKGYFDTVPVSLDEAAKMEGAGRLFIFARILVPLVRPMIAVQALWAFMTPFGEYMLARFLLRSPEALTAAVGLQTFVAEPRTQKVALFAAGALFLSLPIGVLFFLLQKNFLTGLTSGGTKE
jgi:arabinogalactan oligomer/maltooligosaccharide transport system permease protein